MEHNLDPAVEEIESRFVKRLLRIESFTQERQQFFERGKYHGFYNSKIIYCSHCSNEATKKAIYDVVGAQLIEKYCDECLINLNSNY